MKWFNFLLEILGGIRIVLSPLLIGALAGFILYRKSPSDNTLFFGVLLSIVGLVVGVLWANKVWKKQGTIHFLSRIMATPELDMESIEIEKEEKGKTT